MLIQKSAAVFSLIAKNWEQFTCSSTGKVNEQNKLDRTMEYCLAVKRNKLICAKTWVVSVGLYLVKKKKKKPDSKDCLLNGSFYMTLWKRRNCGDRIQTAAVTAWGLQRGPENFLATGDVLDLW